MLRIAAAIQTERWELANDLVDELASMAPSNPRLPLYRARMIFVRAFDEDANDWVFSPEQLEEIKALCARALEDDPDSVWARQLIVRASLVAKEVDEITLELVNELRQLAPGLTHIRYDQVYVLMALCRIDQALERVEQMSTWTHKGSEKRIEALRQKIMKKRSSCRRVAP